MKILRRQILRGYTITRYIQDRTVIEDTESSIDIIQKGWSVYNYLASLAYSATPSDYGSLIIQRRRWANGGLIIFPKLVRYFLFGPGSLWSRIPESFIRAHYLLSIALVNIGLLIMILYPFSDNLNVGPLAAASLLYFWLYARDLQRLGYQGSDLLRVYALNILMIPINLTGVFKSIEQLITNAKIPFGRTPKIQGRTSAAPYFIWSNWALMAYMLFGTIIDVQAARYLHAVFAGINGLFLLYACHRFIGWRDGWYDLTRAWRRDSM